MGSSRRRRTFKPRSGSHGGGYRSRGTSPHRRAYMPRGGHSSTFNRFQQPRHLRKYRRNQGYHPVNDPRGRAPIAQGDGTWYDPESGEYFRKESLGEMLRRWFSFFRPGSK